MNHDHHYSQLHRDYPCLVVIRLLGLQHDISMFESSQSNPRGNLDY